MTNTHAGREKGDFREKSTVEQQRRGDEIEKMRRKRKKKKRMNRALLNGNSLFLFRVESEVEWDENEANEKKSRILFLCSLLLAMWMFFSSSISSSQAKSGGEKSIIHRHSGGE